MKNQSIRAVFIADDETVYAGTGKGIYSRRPEADTWILISEGLKDESIEAMVVDKNGKIYAGTFMGLHVRSPEGKWSKITLGTSGIVDREPEGSGNGTAEALL